jgi:HK97 family phage major capsid protein
MVFAHLVDLAIFQGSGSGQPQGILTGTGTVSIAKEGSQTADTVVAQNVLKIWSRLYAPWRPGAVWLINQDVEPQLTQMYIVDQESTPVSSWPVYLPAGGFAGLQFATLFGRPVHFTQVCETLGDKGDIMVANLKQYLILEKAGGMKTSTSIHFWFDQDALALKVVMRIAGQPMFDDTIAARDGTTTYSAFVTLDERT